MAREPDLKSRGRGFHSDYLAGVVSRQTLDKLHVPFTEFRWQVYELAKRSYWH